MLPGSGSVAEDLGTFRQAVLRLAFDTSAWRLWLGILDWRVEDQLLQMIVILALQ